MKPEDKVKFLKAAWDAIGSEFGSRHTQYEMFYAGARFVTTGHSYRTFDWAGANGMVDRLMATYDLSDELSRAPHLAPASLAGHTGLCGNGALAIRMHPLRRGYGDAMITGVGAARAPGAARWWVRV